MVPSYPTPTALQLEQQANFEVEAFNEGVRRYREALAGEQSWAGEVGGTVRGRHRRPNMTELTAGQKLLKEIVPGLAAGIAKAKAEAVEAIGRGDGAKGGRVPLWAWPIGLLAGDDADEKLAVIALGCVLSMPVVQDDDEDGGYAPDRTSMPLVPLARHITAAVRVQIEFDRWKGDNPELAKRLRTRYPNLHRNVWSRWRKKVNALRVEPWDAATEVALGEHLVHLLVAAAPTRFLLELRPLRGKPTWHLTISDETLDLINDVTTRAEIARPLLMPMICPPKPWRYEQ
jgi:hypothetical protein